MQTSRYPEYVRISPSPHISLYLFEIKDIIRVSYCFPVLYFSLFTDLTLVRNGRERGVASVRGCDDAERSP